MDVKDVKEQIQINKMSNKKYSSLTIKEKLKMIEEYKSINLTKLELCEKYACSKSTFNRILKSEEQIVGQSLKCNPLKKRRLRGGACVQVEQALSIWYRQMAASGAMISASEVKEKAKQFAIALNENFLPTPGWLWRWQKREDISFKKVNKTSVETDTLFTEIVLSNIIHNYDMKDIFNATETALYYRALPNAVYPSARLTLLFIVNALGDHKQLIVIGKTAVEQNTPLKYYTHQKTWMTLELWQEILFDLNEQLREKNRKIILFVDDAACHRVKQTFSNIKLQYLPTASVSCIRQPLREGIMRAFKIHYKNLLLQHDSQVAAGKCECDLSIIEALNYIHKAWTALQQEYIQNCFQQTQFISLPIPICSDAAQYNIPDHLHNYITCDDNLDCYGKLTDEEIVQEVVAQTQKSLREKPTTAANKPQIEHVDILTPVICMAESDGEEQNILNPISSSTIASSDIPSCEDVAAALDVLRKYFCNNDLCLQHLQSLEQNVKRFHSAY